MGILTAKTFTMQCSKCEHDNDFKIEEVEDLAAYIEDERVSSYDEGKADAEEVDDPEQYIDVGVLFLAARPLWELSAAIRRGDRAEAEHQLDLIAESIGTNAVEQVQQARFSSRAKAV